MVRESLSSPGEAAAIGMEEEEEEVMKPAWLQSLMSETFFGTCGLHQNRRKNEKNVFCLHCCHSFCPHCLPFHHSHPLLQVRRYVYQNVIRLDDLEKLMDCSYIQPYTINSAKVIFLNERAQSRSCKMVSGNSCLTCDRILQEPFNFCSLSCKVDYMEHQGEDLSRIINGRMFDESDLTLSQLEGLRMDVSDDPSSILQDPLVEYRERDTDRGSSVVVRRQKNSGSGSGSSTSTSTGSSNSGGRRRLIPNIMLSLGSSCRRKGVPHRSPLS